MQTGRFLLQHIQVGILGISVGVTACGIALRFNLWFKGSAFCHGYHFIYQVPSGTSGAYIQMKFKMNISRTAGMLYQAFDYLLDFILGKKGSYFQGSGSFIVYFFPQAVYGPGYNMLCYKAGGTPSKSVKVDCRDKYCLFTDLGIRAYRKAVFKIWGLLYKADNMLIYLLKGQVVIF